MIINKYKTEKFRNLENICFEPDSEMNIIFGENGQGKTNIIESLWVFTGCHSFRTSKNSELIKKGEAESVTQIDFFSYERNQNALMKISQKREFQLNGIWQSSPRKMLGEYRAVIFSPASLFIVQNGPSERRRFLDVAISQVKPNYAAVFSKYMRALNQRNSLLKQGNININLLKSWDAELARYGARLLVYRYEYLEELSPFCDEIYKGISGGKEVLSFKYLSSAGEERTDRAKIETALIDLFEQNIDTDIRRQYTSAGPHKDDLDIRVNNASARCFASQGQQRSCALALKLGEASMVGKITRESPVILLDDVMSELDEGRQNYLLGFLENRQVFITCCDPSQLMRRKKGKAFSVENGKLTEM